MARQLAAAAALSSAVTVGVFVVQRILGQSTPWGGIATATVTAGTAFMLQVLARMMNRHGRRYGLRFGYGLAIVGGLTAGIGAETKSLVVFVIGLFIYGSGQASNLMSRYAATDLALPEQWAGAMGRILFAWTFGAVLGPVLVQSVGQGRVVRLAQVHGDVGVLGQASDEHATGGTTVGQRRVETAWKPPENPECINCP